MLKCIVDTTTPTVKVFNVKNFRNVQISKREIGWLSVTRKERNTELKLYNFLMAKDLDFDATDIVGNTCKVMQNGK